MALDVKTIDWDSVQIDDVYWNDYPDFCDAYFASGNKTDGTPLSDDELDELRDACPDRLWSKIMDMTH